MAVVIWGDPDEPEPFPLDGIVEPPPPPPLHAAKMAIAQTAKKERIGRLLSIIPPVMAKLYFRYSAMNAGKSTALIQVAHNYEENGRTVALFTSAIDDRYGPGTITSRIGPRRTSKTYNESFDFFAAMTQMRDISCLLVDEAQFLTPNQVRQLHRGAHQLDIPVICYGIRSDFLGEPFPGSAYLLTLADSIEELKNICACGRKATMNPRFADNVRVFAGDQVAIEGRVEYKPMCARCFYEGQK
ncbi:MAG TPA: thymidine kinase [Candidatus Aquilonibacter sp.]